MPDRNLILKLARVVIAAAWADGEITNDEINSLKDLVFRLRQSVFDEDNQLSAQEWSRLDMYIESPVGAAERSRLVADLQDAVRSEADKQFVRRTLQEMMAADGDVSQDEKEVLAEIEAALDSSGSGLFGGLQRLMGGAVQRRTEEVANAPNREVFFDDFIKNKVYYNVSRRLEKEGTKLDLSEAELRKLSLAGGLMAKVAHVDREVSESEFEGMVNAMQRYWGVSPEAATFVAEVAISAVDVNYDTYRMMRELATNTTEEQRRNFLIVLFTVSAADGKIGNDEAEEIRLVSRSLNLTHKDFINAKLAVLGEQSAS